MTALPSGTVTLLFTDIEGSSKLWDEHRSAMAVALVEHNRILTDAITGHSGVIVKDKGDGYFAAFTSTEEAIKATIDTQRSLADVTWPDPIETIKVRMAVHVGHLDGTDGDYHGPVVNRVARLEGIAHGGQVLISDATRSLVEDVLPSGVTLLDLGAHTLRGMARPERVYQLIAAGLLSNFPPLRVDALPGIPLPDFPTSFVGREADSAAITDLLADNDCRLVTLLGPGGIGKTRLGVETARALANRYAGGAFFVDLTPVSATADVAIAIAAAVGARPEGTASPIALAADRITSPTLLVLDNFEHVQDASPLAAELLGATSSLDVIATSRAPLRVRGERIYQVAPLASNANGSSPAVSLFYERAAEHGTTISRDGAEAAAVQRIVRHLDGLPLAIELVAARTRLIGITELAPMIERSLDAFGTGAVDAPERQRTIRSTIEWSLQSLTDAQRTLFARLSVFPDGATLAQIEAVADGDTIGDLTALVDNSLVTVVVGIPGGTRYKQLVLLREYAAELLVAADEAEATMQRLVDYYISTAHDLGRRQRQSAVATNEVDADYNNLDRTMRWVAEHGYRTADVVAAQCEMWVYWFNGDVVSRAISWFVALDALVDTPKADWLGALFALQQGDYQTAVPRFYRALDAFSSSDDGYWKAMAQIFAGMLTEDLDQAIPMLTEACDYFAQPVDPVDGLMPRLILSMKLADQGDWDAAVELRQTLANEFATLNYPIMQAWVEVNLSLALAAVGRADEAREKLRLGFDLMLSIGNQEGIVNTAQIIATVALVGSHYEEGLRLLGASETALAKLEVGYWPEMDLLLDQRLSPLRLRIGNDTANALIAEGRTMSFQAIKERTTSLLDQI